MTAPERDKYVALIKKYLMEQLPFVLKQPNDCLRHPFIDPGSVYDGNLWDWDTFWATYSLLNAVGDLGEGDGEGDTLRLRVLEHAKGNIYNFFDYQLEDGYIPMMVEKSELPEPYLIMKHKQGHILNMHKPFLCQQICLISGYAGDFGWMAAYEENLERYFQCYDRHYYNDQCGLYVWADDVMIGADNDPATFGRPRFSTANIFLNSFMIIEMKSMARILQNLGKHDRAGEYLAKAEKLTACIQEECWDKRDRFFYSVDVDVKTRKYDWFHVGLGVFWKTLPIKIRMWSSFLPLWAGIASKDQAEDLVRLHITDENTFMSPYGIRSLSKDERMYNLTPTINPSNWLGPIWLIVNYIVFRSLIKYGYRSEAEELCEKTLTLLGRDLEATGTLHEYYVPETGQPVMNGGFLNWNLLALNMAAELEGKPSMDRYLG